jgi:hypothetical protein
MPRFRLDSMTQLARQLEFAPHEVRAQQIEAAEELLYLIDPAKAYPLAFVIFRITGYHPKASAQELLTGIALQHDLDSAYCGHLLSGSFLAELLNNELALRQADDQIKFATERFD